MAVAVSMSNGIKDEIEILFNDNETLAVCMESITKYCEKNKLTFKSFDFDKSMLPTLGWDGVAMIQYFETNSYAEIVAFFKSEIIYESCFKELGLYAKKSKMFTSESEGADIDEVSNAHWFR